MTPDEALEFVRTHGVVLVSARGPVPTLTEAIVGGPIKGSWWGHPEGKRIFAILQTLGEDEAVLTCKLVGGKQTLVHQRLWPALCAARRHFKADALARVVQVHIASGKHVNQETPFPDWVPQADLLAAEALSPAQALAILGSWVEAK